MGRKSKDIRNVKMSDFYCTSCGNKGIPVFRTIGQEKEPGHLKKLFCLHCQEEKNMVEIRPIGKYTVEDFWIEYEYGNFTDTGERIESWKTFVNKIKQKGFKHE